MLIDARGIILSSSSGPGRAYALKRVPQLQLVNRFAKMGGAMQIAVDPGVAVDNTQTASPLARSAIRLRFAAAAGTSR
ncbi:hypothetical protein [Microbacterium tumbae]